jgi:hypothetical protein
MTGGNPNPVKTYLSFLPELCSRFVLLDRVYEPHFKTLAVELAIQPTFEETK